MRWETINFEVRENGVALLTMNRPRQLNAFNDQILLDIKEAVKTVRENDEIKVPGYHRKR